MSETPRTIREELEREPVVVPTAGRFGNAVVSWSEHRIRIVRVEEAGERRRITFGPGDVQAVQVSRAERIPVEPGQKAPVGRSHDDATSFIDVELRGRGAPRIRLSAPAPPELLEGIPYYDAPGLVVSLEAARGVVAAARAMGARVTKHGAPALVERESSAPVTAGSDHVAHSMGTLTLREHRDKIRIDATDNPARVYDQKRKLTWIFGGVIALLIAFDLGALFSPFFLLAAGLAMATPYIYDHVAGRRLQGVRVDVTFGDEPTLHITNEQGELGFPLEEIRAFETRRIAGRGKIEHQPVVVLHDNTRVSLVGDETSDATESAAVATALNALVLERTSREDAELAMRAADDARRRNFPVMAGIVSGILLLLWALIV